MKANIIIETKNWVELTNEIEDLPIQEKNLIENSIILIMPNNQEVKEFIKNLI